MEVVTGDPAVAGLALVAEEGAKAVVKVVAGGPAMAGVEVVEGQAVAIDQQEFIVYEYSLPEGAVAGRQEGVGLLLDHQATVSKSISYRETVGGEVEGGSLVSTHLLPSSISGIVTKERNLRCDFCAYTTNRRCHLNDHYRMIHLKVKVICDLCGKEFSSEFRSPFHIVLLIYQSIPPCGVSITFAQISTSTCGWCTRS